jgi:AraC-like DNA-binding protein
VLYLESSPQAPLNRAVRVLWYARATEVGHARERILPNGCVQVILNLQRDFLLDCPEDQPEVRMAPALVVGARSVYEIVDSSDMADLIGVVFQPAGFPLFARDAADRFSNRNVALEAVWGAEANGLRDRLREVVTPGERLACMEGFLAARYAAAMDSSPRVPRPEIAFALRAFAENPAVASVAAVARATGWSERRFSQVFREQVGLTPKTWCRIQRFQRAVRQLHAGGDVRWAELALDCGYYDQSHFANEFRAFSGIDATSYCARRTQWANHTAIQ